MTDDIEILMSISLRTFLLFTLRLHVGILRYKFNFLLRRSVAGLWSEAASLLSPTLRTTQQHIIAIQFAASVWASTRQNSNFVIYCRLQPRRGVEGPQSLYFNHLSRHRRERMKAIEEWCCAVLKMSGCTLSCLSIVWGPKKSHIISV